MSPTRRTFLTSMVAVAAGRVLTAQLPKETAHLWGSPVIDCHFHMRPTLEANLAHINGSGCTQAYFPTRIESSRISVGLGENHRSSERFMSR